MAGIGFRIQKLLDRDTYLGAVEGYMLGAFVAAGPLVILVFTTGVLSLLSSHRVSSDDVVLFRVTLVHAYAISLLTIGFFQLSISRYVADLIYGDEQDRILPTLLSLLVLMTAINAPLGLLIFGFSDRNWWYIFRAVSLLVLVGNVWVVMIFITATRQYLAIGLAFVGGCCAAIYFGDKLGTTCGIIGYLEGYAIGQALILIVLLGIIAREFPCHRLFNFGLLRHHLDYPELTLIGLLLNLGIWTDKFVFWGSDLATITAGCFRTFDLYDSVTFLAYMSTVPALTYFLVRVETRFYIYYRRYFSVIANQGSLHDIKHARDELLEELGEGMGAVVKVQMLTTLICLVLTSDIMKLLHLSPIQWSMFRVSLLGSMLLVFMQLVVTLMLYFDLRGSALCVALVYCLGNYAFTNVTLYLGPDYFGYGFTLAALVGLAVSYLLLNRGVNHLLYRTFGTQPIPKPRPEV